MLNEKPQWYMSGDYYRLIPDENHMLTVSRMMNTKMFSAIIWKNGEKVFREEYFNPGLAMHELERIFKSQHQ